MKKVLLFFIDIYQKIPGPWHKNCRYIPTCSEYAKIAIERFGALKGSYLTLKRILRCNPWGKSGFDPVPSKKGKEDEKNK